MLSDLRVRWGPEAKEFENRWLRVLISNGSVNSGGCSGTLEDLSWKTARQLGWELVCVAIGLSAGSRLPLVLHSQSQRPWAQCRDAAAKWDPNAFTEHVSGHGRYDYRSF